MVSGGRYGHPVGERVVEVWWAGASDDRLGLLALLDDVERRRVGAFRHGGARATFVVAAALSRLVLGERLGIDPRQVPLERACPGCGGPHGRPRLAYGGPVHSVSHSGTLVAVAVGAGGGDEHAALGVDVQLVDPQLPPPVDDVLTPVEQDDGVDIWDAWVRKEAVLKATGEGLRRPMTDLRCRPAGVVTYGADFIAQTCALTVPGWCDRIYAGSSAALGPGPVRVVDHDGRAWLTS